MLFPHKSRTFGIRVSEEEYMEWSGYCSDHRIRSIAELTRQAIRKFIMPASDKTEDERDKHVRRLEKKVRELSTEMMSLKAVQKNSAEGEIRSNDLSRARDQEQ